MLNPKQHNIATGPQGTRWGPELINHDDRWRSMEVREHGRAYAEDVTKTHIAAEEGTTANTPYYPGQGGPGTQSQGKLFHDPKPVDPHRWPRGYTPERQSDVSETFRDAPEYGRMPGKYRAIPGQARDTIARSAMPTKDLNRLRGGEYGDRSTFIMGAQVNDRFAGQWDSRQDFGNSRSRGTISLTPDAKDHTVLHEVGHAMSTARGTDEAPTKHGSVVVTDKESGQDHRMYAAGAESRPGLLGAEEGRADAYGTQYAREKGGTPAVKRQNYDGQAAYPAHVRSSNDAHEFNRAYEGEHAEQGVPTPRDVDASLKSEEHAAALASFKADAKPSPHIFQRPGMSSSGFAGNPDHIPMPTEPDYGQYGATTPDGTDVGTIKVGGGLPPDIKDSVTRRERQKARVNDLMKKRREERNAGRMVW